MIQLCFPIHVRNRSDFYGRQNLLEQIWRSYTNEPPSSVVIVGERRIGKTSLQIVSTNSIAGIKKIIPIYIPLLTSEIGINEFLSVLVHSIISKFGPIDLGLSTNPKNYLEFELFLSSQLQGLDNTLIILCIDEFDNILNALQQHTREAEAREILNVVDNLIENRSNLPLVLNITMTNLPNQINDSYQSPGISKSEFIRLIPMSEQDSNTLIQGITAGEITFSRESLHKIYQYSFGHPYFIKLLLEKLINHHFHECNLIQVDESMLEGIVSEALQDTRTQYILANIYDIHFSSDEKKMILLLTQRGAISDHESNKLNKSYISALQQLVQKGYFIKVGNVYSWGILILKIMFQHWERFEEECEIHHIPELMQLSQAQIRIDLLNRSVLVQDEEIKLTKTEFDVLVCLAREDGKPVSRDEIINILWPGEKSDKYNNNAIDKTISRIREKIGDEYLITERGLGFRLMNTVIAGGSK